MAQHDMNIANQGFPATRADLNNALQALVSNSSGTSAPSTTFANQWWYDTTNNKLYIRNEANNAWIEVAVLDQTNNEWQISTGVIQAKDSDGLALKTDDGTTRLFIKDSDGSVGIGTTTTSGELTVGDGLTGTKTIAILGSGSSTSVMDLDFLGGGSGNPSGRIRYSSSTEEMTFHTGDLASIAERMTIRSDGNTHIAGSLAVGVEDYPFASGNRGYVHIEGSAGALLALEDTGNQSYIFNQGSDLLIQNTSNGNMTFATNNVERARFQGGGDFLVGKTSNSDTVGGAMVTYESSENGGRFTATADGSTGGALFLGNSTSGNVALIRCDGDFECINNRYTGFSDERLKENIVDSNSQWDDVKSVRVRKFSWKADELDAPNKLGVIAQELEALGMSSLVSTNEDLNDPEQERKTVAYSILYMKAFKALQEAMTRIETLETKVAALENA